MAGRATRPSAKRMPSGVSFQPWLQQAAVGGALVLDVAVAVAVAEVVDPLEGAVGVGHEPVDRLGRQAPAPQLAEQHDEQGRGVDRAVVDGAAAEREGRGGPEPHLVQDAAGLLLGARVDVGALEPGEGLERRRGPGRGRPAAPSSAVRSESRPNTVMNHGTPAATTARSGRSGSKMRSAPRSSPPRATVRARPSWSVSTTGRPRRHSASARPAWRARPGRRSGTRGTSSSPSMTGLSCRQVCHSPRAGTMVSKRARSTSRTGSPQLSSSRAAPPVAAVWREVHPALVDGDRCRRPAGPPVAHVDQVGEVGREPDLDRAVGGLVAEVADDDVLTQALAQVAAPHDHQGGARRVGGGGDAAHAAHEGGREGLVAHRRERLGRGAVDQHLEGGEQPRAAEEEALGGVGEDVARGLGDRERHPFDEGDERPGAQRRWHVAACYDPPDTGCAT